jgi:hypothetical protein
MRALLAIALSMMTFCAYAQEDVPARKPHVPPGPGRTDIGKPDCVIDCTNLNPKLAPAPIVPMPPGPGTPVPSHADMIGPKFVFAWTAEDRETILRALSKIPKRHGVDGFQMRQLAYALRVLDSGTQLVDKDGKPWAVYTVYASIVSFIGRAVSNDRYCRAEDALAEDLDEIDNVLVAMVYCYVHNRNANRVTEQIKASRHMTPGGAP